MPPLPNEESTFVLAEAPFTRALPPGACATAGSVWIFKVRGCSIGRLSISDGELVSELAPADWPWETRISPEGLKTATMPSLTETRKPACGPGEQVGLHTVNSAMYSVPRMPIVAVGVRIS